MVDVNSLGEPDFPTRASERHASPASSSAPARPAVLAANAAWMAAFKAAEMAQCVEHMQAGRLVTAHDLAALLSISKRSVIRAERAGRLFSMPGPDDVQLYPAFFADPRLKRAQLERVTHALGEGIPGARKWAFFTTPKTSLQAQTPLAALADGRIDDVLRAAAGEAGR